MYVLAWLLNYGFGFATAYNTQNVVGQEPAWRYFLDRIALFPLAIVWTYKLYFAAIPLGIWTYWKAGRLNLVCYILVAFGLSVAVCSIATDTTRMVSLSTLAVIAGALPWLPRMSERQRRGLAWANLLIPTLYSTSNSTGVFVVRGIYGLVLSQLPNVTVAAGWH
jgi:ABC-type transport system involved in multi-copper enzyme maturation permease subunit